jgi:type III pantothenate kinase
MRASDIESQVLLIDVGNTAIKWCVVTGSIDAIKAQRCPRELDHFVAAVTASVSGLSSRPAVWLASVSNETFDRELTEALQGAGFESITHVVTASEELGLRNSYSEPQRMGVDRWLAMIAASYGRPEPCLVIDVGTALTIDVIAGDGQHLGGYIVPGIDLMQSALFRDTQRVRFTEQLDPATTPGSSTAACVVAGSWAALLGATTLVTRRYPDHRIVITGGAGRDLLSLGLDGEWRPDLVLEGLAIKAANDS